MINYYFYQFLKKSEISTYYQPVHSFTTNETILTKQYIAFTKKCTVEESISCTIFFLQLCGWVQKQPFGGAPRSTCYYMMRKYLKNSSREIHFLVRVQFTGLQCWQKWTCLLVFFNGFNGKPFIVALRFSKRLFKHWMAASVCYF